MGHDHDIPSDICQLVYDTLMEGLVDPDDRRHRVPVIEQPFSVARCANTTC